VTYSDVEALGADCSYWAKQLRLQDWDIKVSFARLYDLGEGCLGDCEPHKIKRQARIRLLDARDVECQLFWFDGEAWNQEVTLVHELLHLHFYDFIKEFDSPAGIAAERAIHRISRSLVQLRSKA
jgi:hypothetical protein